MVNYNLSYYAQWCGMTCRTANLYSMQGVLNRMVSASTGELKTVVLTGFYFNGQSGIWMQTWDQEWVLSSEVEMLNVTGYQISAEQVQKMINGMIANNKRIYENNLLCAKFANRLNESERQQVALLQGRLKLRDTALRLNTNLTDRKESYPEGYINYYQNLEALSEGVGIVVTTTAMIIISVVLIASLATSVYFAFRAWAKESEDDVKYSDALTKKLLAKLTPEEFAQLKSETAGMLTRAKLTGRFAGVSGLLKWALLGTGAVFLYNEWRKRKKLN